MTMPEPSKDVVNGCGKIPKIFIMYVCFLCVNIGVRRLQLLNLLVVKDATHL